MYWLQDLYTNTQGKCKGLYIVHLLQLLEVLQSF